MASAKERHPARFAAAVQALEKERGVTYAKQGSQVFRHSALKINDNIFAMDSSAGHFVVKLPKGGVDSLVAAGAGKALDFVRRLP